VTARHPVRPEDAAEGSPPAPPAAPSAGRGPARRGSRPGTRANARAGVDQPRKKSRSERRHQPRRPRRDDLASPEAQAVYRRVMDTLRAADIRFLVGGAYAFTPYTGIERSTKDFDLFVRQVDIHRALDVLEAAGFHTEMSFPHWLAKAYHGEDFVDLIFNSGNGVTPVDDDWFGHAPSAEVLGLPVHLMPPEEMLASKSFVMERERYDGADVIHLLRAKAEKLDWQRVLKTYGPHWRVLLLNLVLFGFVYPGERTRIPRWVMDELLGRLRTELHADADVERLCQGTVVSRQQYLPDVLEWGYSDGRLEPRGGMTAEQIEEWTAAIDNRK
jgi:hypothetical protein